MKPDPRLERLLNRWLDGELDGPEEAAVQRMLVEDHDARRVYYDLLMVDKMLDESFSDQVADHDVIDSLADDMVSSHRKIVRFPVKSWSAGIAAAVAFTLFALFSFKKPAPVEASGPVITASIDSRITIAQRQDTSRWEVGELLRLERGTADIQLTSAVTGNFEGPAAIELTDRSGNIRMLEGMASFQVKTGGNRLDVRVPGGVLRDMSSRFSTEVLTDGSANVRVESGLLEISPRGASAKSVYLHSGDAMRLEPDGSTFPIRLPNQHFRSGLPEQLTVFKDEFHSDGDQPLQQHNPDVGQAWKVLSETNPTFVHNQTLDTSSGARSLLATLAPHDAGGPRSVYIFTFHLLPPQRIDDKVKRIDGVESISLTDDAGHPFLSIFAEATNSHRWQLRDEHSKAVTALTPVCALWTHSLTLCYGLDGRATLHDGATAQAPVIAEMHIEKTVRTAGILLSNRSGGDLAFAGIETTLLPVPAEEP